MSHALGWARLWAVARPLTDPMLRQGAWYPVVNRGSDFVVVDVHRRHVTVPTHCVEVRGAQPDRFTVVYRSHADENPARHTPEDLGRQYAVCPTSGDRLRLLGQPEQLRCPTCGHHGMVAWWETG
jgi:hypothetical protein